MRNSLFTILFCIISTSNCFGCLGPRVTGWDCVRPNKPDPHYGSISIAGVLALSVWFSLAFAMAQTKAPSTATVPQFEDVSKQAGLTASHISTAEQHYIIESMSGGIALFDCDDDGKLDIAMVNGSTVAHYRDGGDPLITLYHQDENLKFSNITQSAGLKRKGWGMGIAVADFDNDGKLDMFVTGYGGSALYRGLGNCKFEDVTDKAGVLGSGYMTGAAWADYDRDGNVDLFVARYVHLDMNKLPEFGSNEKFCRYKGILVQCGPWGMEGESDLLYHNRGDGTFEEVGLLTGTALSADGQELGSMGVDFGDYRHEGRLSIFVTNFTDQSNNLYHNLGSQGFTDEGWASKTSQPSFPYVKWGTGFVDFSNTSWLDLFVANGHVYPQVDAIPGGVKYRQPMQLFRNMRDGTFEDISVSSGLAQIPVACRRGAAFGDVNNDGNMDIAILNVGEPPTLLINRTRNANHRVLFKLIGAKSNRAAIGARVTILAAGVRQFSEVRGGGSYLSQNDLRQHFGLGAATKIDSVEIRWPTGKVEMLENIASDAIYTIVEEEGIRDTKPLPPPPIAAPSGS